MTKKKLMMMAFAAVAAAFGAWADTETVGDYTWTYRINGDTAEIYGNRSSYTPAISPKPTGAVTIPSTLGGKPVTSIGDLAFCGCSGLTSVTIGNGVTTIGWRAFMGCTGLTSVTIPDSVTNIFGFSFEYCFSLTNVVISSGLTRIGYGAFHGCSGLTSVTIPDGVTDIENYAFEGCSNVREATVPGRDCGIPFDNVTNLIISVGTTSIGSEAFSGCSGLTSVTIPNSVTNIGDSAFSGCSGLTSVTMKGNCPTVGSTAFGSIADECVARLPKGNTTYDVVDGKWQGMTVEYYDLPSAPTVAIDDTKMEMPVEQDGKRVIAAKEGETITAGDVDSIKISSPIDSTDITAAYVKTLVGNQITIELATPQVGVLPEQAEEAPDDEDDATGLLVVVDESEISAKPEPKNEETVGALPVKTYPGLWYQAEWGDDIGNLTSGDKVQATGGSLYLGVIKQTGGRGFYKISVSEK